MDKTDKLVDEILDGNYKQVKVVESAMDMVDVILDMCEEEKVSETANAIDHVPDEDADELLSNVEDELGSEERDRKQLERKVYSEEELIKTAFNEVIAERTLIYKAYEDVRKDKELEQKKIAEGWGDVAGSALSGANRAFQSKAIDNQIQKTKATIQKVKAELAKCGDSKWCKVKKHTRLVALGNQMNQLRRKRGH